jgi:hypothetical protein
VRKGVQSSGYRSPGSTSGHGFDSHFSGFYDVYAFSGRRRDVLDIPCATSNLIPASPIIV